MALPMAVLQSKVGLLWMRVMELEYERDELQKRVNELLAERAISEAGATAQQAEGEKEKPRWQQG